MDASGKNAVEQRRSVTRTRTQRADYLKPLLKLKHQEDMLERGLVNLIDNMKVDQEIIADLTQEKQKLDAKRQSILDDMNKILREIRVDLDAVRSTLNDSEQIKTLDTNELKSKLVRLSQRIENFKKNCPLSTLDEENTPLDSEIKEFSLKLDKYATVNNNLTKMSAKRSLCHKDKAEQDDCEDEECITDFHALIAKTGYTQNWSNEDHLLFLKLRKKCKNIPTLVTTMRTKCPDLSAETIINHEAWYRMYEDLREKQKTKVKEWRNRKQLNKPKKSQANEKTSVKNL